VARLVNGYDNVGWQGIAGLLDREILPASRFLLFGSFQLVVNSIGRERAQSFGLAADPVDGKPNEPAKQIIGTNRQYLC